MMRADYCLFLIAGKARLLERAAQDARDSMPSPPIAPGGGQSIQVKSLDQIYALFGGKGGPRGI